MRLIGPFPEEVRVGSAGATLGWPRRSPEARYCGTFIPWSLVRDADPDASTPQLRLTDGRTVFLRRRQGAELTAGLIDAGVATRKRPDVWSELLEPFLDVTYDDADRARCEGRLRSWGFTDREIRDIRRRVRVRMLLLTMSTWEWVRYFHEDVILATGWVPASRYLRFRGWADAIAARGDQPDLG